MYSSILVAVDLDEPSSWQLSIPAALAIGKCFEARVGLVYVVSNTRLALDAEWSSLALRRILETERARLGLLAEELGTGSEIQTHVATGQVFRGILEVAERERADLLVVGSHAPGMKQSLIGDTAERVVRHARCSVMVVRP